MTEHTGLQFTVDNWGYPPQNRESFQQVQSLFPTARLRRGPGPITTLKSDSKDNFSFSYEGADGSQRTVQKMLADSYTDAFIVMKENVIVKSSNRVKTEIVYPSDVRYCSLFCQQLHHKWIEVVIIVGRP